MQSSIISDRLCIAQNMDNIRVRQPFKCFRPRLAMQYEPFCDDFGPVNISCIASFIKSLDLCFDSFPQSKIVFCVEKGRRSLTNAVFLLGAYMVLKENLTSDEVAECFESRDKHMFEAYRDATYAEPDFGLGLLDCWRGLEQGKQQGWVRVSWTAEFCGKVNIHHYRHYDEPSHGDLHEVVPGKFIAFKGPVDLGGRDFQDQANGVRVFSPSYYIDIFREMGVSTIIRLNEPRYDAKDFTSRGFEHFDLEFEDCTCPPDEIVVAFFKIVDSAPGVLAVHCHAGLGRTGTLIALHLMRSRRFTAREAMGWLRVMRPGSVIGEQQHYLCEVERLLSAARRSRETSARGAALRRSSSLPDRLAPASRAPGLPSHSPVDAGGPQPPAPSTLMRRTASASSLAGDRPSGSSARRDRPGPMPAPAEPAPAAAELAAQVSAGMLRRSASYRGRSPA